MTLMYFKMEILQANRSGFQVINLTFAQWIVTKYNEISAQNTDVNSMFTSSGGHSCFIRDEHED